ncbi:hypothetical protein IWQ60_010919, partial [Tieghemiomyces parasiticus]
MGRRSARRRNARDEDAKRGSDEEPIDPTEPRFLDEEEQEKKIKDLKEEDEIINAQFK